MTRRAHAEGIASVQHSPEGTLSSADRIAWWIATGAGSGRAPIAPGTVGALLGLGLFALSSWLEHALGAVGLGWGIAGVLLGIGTWASSRAGPLFGKTDPPPIVIDEVAGQFLTLLLVVGGRVLFSAERAELWPRWEIALASFVFFRLFDIWKPYPIRRVERWAGGVGIMADDVLAGVYAGLAALLLAEFVG
mgnify:CR=1 FL=1